MASIKIWEIGRDYPPPSSAGRYTRKQSYIKFGPRPQSDWTQASMELKSLEDYLNARGISTALHQCNNKNTALVAWLFTDRIRVYYAKWKEVCVIDSDRSA